MSDFGGPDDDDFPRGSYSSPAGARYGLSGRIMLTAIIVLFFVVLLMVFLHLYARWYLLRSRRRRQFVRRNRHNRPTHIVFYIDPTVPSDSSRGLDASVLRSLPVFAYSARDEPLECAVCLSEFEEAEKARLLPKCGHSFHIDCIDMWFQSHATCPICRSFVEPLESPGTKPAPQLPSAPSESDTNPTSISLCLDCQCHESATASRASPSSSRRKSQELVGITVEVPRRTEFDEESACESPASQYRSPISRVLSLRRILSREWRGSVSPSAAEIDIERGRAAGEIHHQQPPPPGQG